MASEIRLVKIPIVEGSSCQAMARRSMKHIPFKGGGKANAAVIGENLKDTQISLALRLDVRLNSMESLTFGSDHFLDCCNLVVPSLDHDSRSIGPCFTA